MHHLQDPQIRDKISSTNLQKYGFTNPGSNPHVESRRIHTNLSRYGVSNPMENAEIVEKSLRGRFHISRCIFPENTKKRSIDLWNRCYRDRDEINLAEISTISDIKIYPWEDYAKIKSALLIRRKIDAKDCAMLMLYKKIASQFINKYDIKPFDRRSELCIGLVYQDSLIQVMTIGKSRDLDHTYQIYHLCTKPTFEIQYGAQKMFQYATKDFEVDNIIAYSSTRFTLEFESIGMTKLDEIHTIKIWYHHNLMIPDDQIFDRDLKKMFDILGDSKLQLLQEHDWNQVSESISSWQFRSS